MPELGVALPGMRRGATEGCLLAALSGRATGTTAAATSAAAPGLSTRRYAAASACTRHATHARLATVRRVRMLLEHTRHFVSQYNIDLLLSSASYTFPYHTVFFLLLFSVFLIFTRLFHISSFFIITFGCYNRRNSSSFTGPSFSPTTRYPVFTNGASDSTTTPLLSYLRFRSPSWLRFQRTRTISIVDRLWDR